MSAVDLQPEPRHWEGSKLSLAKFGKIPNTNVNLWRIVFAPTRTHLVGGVWADTGTAEYRYAPSYRSLGDVWVVEKWRSAFEYTNMSKEQWEQRMRDPSTGLMLNPYPETHGGEFDKCEHFDFCTPADANIEKLISWIEAKEKRTMAENNKAIRDNYDAETKDMQNQVDAKIRDKMPSHLGSTVGRYTARVGKSLKTLKTAEQLGLPTSNKFLRPAQRGRILKSGK